MWIKIILIAGILFAGVMMLRTGGSDRNAAIRRLGMAAFTVLAIILVIYPSLTTRMANLVGVKRGADLVFYLLVLAFLGSLLTSAQRNAATDRKITRIARNLALQQVEYPPNKKPATGAQSDAVADSVNNEVVVSVEVEGNAAAAADASPKVVKGDTHGLVAREDLPASDLDSDQTQPAATATTADLTQPVPEASSVMADSSESPATATDEVQQLPAPEADPAPEAGSEDMEEEIEEVGVVPAAVNSALANVEAAITASSANNDPAARFRALTHIDIDPNLSENPDAAAVAAIPLAQRDATVQRLLATVARSRANLAGQDETSAESSD